MTFFLGFVCGAVVGAAAYRAFCIERYREGEVICNEKQKDKEIQKQLERLIAYGNDR